MDFKPLGKRITIEAKRQDEKMGSGLFIPESIRKYDGRVKVIAIGDHPDIKVKPGDTVVIDLGYARNVFPDNNTLFIMEYDNVWGIVEEKEE